MFTFVAGLFVGLVTVTVNCIVSFMFPYVLFAVIFILMPVFVSFIVNESIIRLFYGFLSV